MLPRNLHEAEAFNCTMALRDIIFDAGFGKAGVLGIFLVTTILYGCYYAFRPKPIPGIPFNKDAAGRLFGDIIAMKAAKYRRQWVWGQPREHGTVISQAFLFPFRKPAVIVSDYREAMDICSRRTIEFDRGTRNKECVGITAPNFHFTMESRDPAFKQHRELLRDLMTPRFLQEVAAPRVYENAAALVGLWSLKASKAQGRAFSANHDLYLSTLDMICGVAFGMDKQMSAVGQEIRSIEDFNPLCYLAKDEPVHFPTSPEDSYIESLLDIPEMVSIAQKSPLPTLSQWLALLNPKHARCHWNRRALIRRQTEKALDRISSDGEKHVAKSALDHLLRREMIASSREGREPDFFSPAIRDEVLGYLLGGHDTTATMLSWWTKHMQCHQNVQTRLRRAICRSYPKAATEGRWPTLDEISAASVPYLDAVVEESLRIASVATLICRTATCDTQILGHHIPKGTDIVLSLTGPSLTQAAVPVPESQRTEACREAKDRVPAWGDDIREYRPERWLKAGRGDHGEGFEVFDPNAGPSLAFSIGPRQCFGKKLALLQLKSVIVLLLWNFELQEVDEPLNGWDITEKLVNLPKDCYVKPRRTRPEELRGLL